MKVGKIIRSQGINGDLIVRLNFEIDKNIHLLYVELNLKKGDLENSEYKVAYNIEKFVLLDVNTALIKFREVSERSQTSYLEGKNIYIKEPIKNEAIEFNLKNSQIFGYKVINEKGKKEIGKIIDVKKIKNKYLEKTLMIVKHSNHSIPIPCEKDVIKVINHDKKTVFIKLPEELLEVFITTQ